MKFNETTLRILVRKNYGECFDFYTQKIGLAAIIPTSDLDGDYLRLKEAGVPFLGSPQNIEAWGMRCAYFRDPEGNLFELNAATGV